MRSRIICMLFGIILALSMIGTTALAGLVLVPPQSTKEKGNTTITWDSSFLDDNYTLGDEITMTVNWTVDTGAAVYDDFELKRFTPKGRDPAGGFIISTTPDSTSVVVVFTFDELHLDRTRNVLIGNAHFKLILEIDKVGDPATESLVGYGVNVHVEDPQ